MLRNERGQAAYIFGFIIIFVIAMVAINYWNTRPQERIAILETSFERRELAPGQSTSLMVKIKNMSNVYDANNVLVMVIPTDASVIQVGNQEQTVDIIGKGEERWIEFSISIAGTARKGTYNIEVSISVQPPFQGDNTTTTVDVK